MAFPTSRASLQQVLPGYADPSNLKESLPDEMKLKNPMNAYSVINMRNRRTFLPNTGVNVAVSSTSGQNTVNIPITSEFFIDPTTAYLHFNLKLSGLTGTDADNLARAVPTCGWSWIRKIRVYVNDVEAEVLDNVDLIMRVLKEGCMSGEYSKNNWSYSFDWRDQKGEGYGVQQGVGQAGYSRRPTLSSSFSKAWADVSSTGGVNVSLPLYWIGLFRNQQYFPNGLVPLRLEIETESNINKVLVCPKGGSITGSPVLDITNLRVCTDVVQPSSAYVAAARQLIFGEGGGVMIPLETHVSIRNTNLALTTSSTTVKSSFNLGYKYVKDLFFVVRNQADINDINAFSDAFPYTNTRNFSLNVNGASYPEQPLQEVDEIYQSFLQSCGVQSTIEAPNNVSKYEYELDVSNGNGNTVVFSSITIVDTSAGNVGDLTDAVGQILGEMFNVDNVYNVDDQTESDTTFGITHNEDSNSLVSKHILGLDLEQYHAPPGALTGRSFSNTGYVLGFQADLSTPTSGTITAELGLVAHVLKLARVEGGTTQIVEP